MPKTKPFVGAFLPLFIFFMLIFSASAYEVVHYDSFQYDAVPATLISDHGFTSISSGINKCVATAGTESYLSCSGTSNTYFNQHLNMLGASKCLSLNGSVSGGAVNYSMRVRAKLSKYSGNLLENLLRFSSGSNVSVNGFVGYYPVFNYYSNFSGQTRFYGSSGTGSGYAVWYAGLPIDDWFIMQIDFQGENDAGMYKGSSARYSLLYAGNNYSIVLNEPSAISVPCINFTNYGITLISGAVAYASYIDYAVVLKYSPGESPIDIRVNLTDYYSTSQNDMPSAQIYTADRDNTRTSNVYPTVSCDPVPVPFSDYTTSSCYPLYIRYSSLTDNENNSISEGLFCGYSGGETPKVAYDDFDRTFTYNDMSLYNLSCVASNAVYYFNGVQLYGMNLPSYSNCSGSWKSHFNNDYPSDFSYLSMLSDYILQFDYQPFANKRENIEFFNSLGGTPVAISLYYNSSSNNMEIYSGSDIYSLPLAYLTSDINSNSPIRVSMAFSNNGNTYSLRLSQYTNGTQYNFYSAPVNFMWDFPLSVLKVTETNFDVSSTASDASFIGTFSVDNIQFPAFTSANPTELNHLNCTSANAGSRTGYLFLTDNIHGNNYLDFIPFTWTVSVLGNNDIFQGEDPNKVIGMGFLEMFSGSSTLMYIFVFLIFVVVLIGCLIAGASMGSASAGFFLGAFGGFTWLMIAFLLGLIPIWVIIAIFIMLGAIIAFAVSKLFGTAGGE